MLSSTGSAVMPTLYKNKQNYYNMLTSDNVTVSYEQLGAGNATA